ncbi:VC0807 family protein [Kitasatospora mediocidica]|uniref:VC0807 family protein n=1 Tax=Kitasatospora mediocidica TaxID=58352 RepID=UPI000A02D1C2|nr:VC0807 family protein [Kitasatospora mediocidica]
MSQSVITPEAVPTAVPTVGRPANPLVVALWPLAVDIVVPLAVYYLAHSVAGLGLVASLTLSSVVPAVRTLAGLLRERSVNGLAALMLVVNVVGIALSALAGDPRLMIAKDGAVSSVIGFSILWSAFGARPLMSAGLKPFLTRGEATLAASWDRLAERSTAFRRAERGFSAVWGIALVADCALRIVLAYTVPVATMAWLSTVLLIGAIGVASVASGPFSERMKSLLTAETA